MSKTTLINGESLSASLEITLAVEQFLKENYLFRRNVLNGKVELATKQASKNGENAEEETPDNWRPLTQEALNSIIRRAKKNRCARKAVRRRKSWSLYTLRMCQHTIPSATT